MTPNTLIDRAVDTVYCRLEREVGLALHPGYSRSLKTLLCLTISETRKGRWKMLIERVLLVLSLIAAVMVICAQV
jgi:hypothetical protein